MMTVEYALIGYAGLSAIIGGIAALALFFGTWWWSSERWGALCFLFGWLPASIVAYLGFWLVGAFWPFVVISYAVRRR